VRFESPRAFDPKGRGACTGRAALERRTVHNIDVIADPEYNDGGRQLDPDRTVLAIPMLKADDLLGVILIYRHKVLAFTDSQIALMETFADQAVIAIENTRLFEEVQARTCELQESLEYQTATAEVLNVISRSPNQLQPVLDAIVGTADRLCRSEFAAVYRLKDDKYWLAATNRIDPTILNILRQEPITPGRGTIVGRAALERRTLRVLDCLADPEFGWLEAQRAGKHRTMLAVQLLRDHAPSGVVILSRTVVMPFSNKEIELVESFADQAVIAIENTRLFGEVQARTRELTEALEQQTAISEFWASSRARRANWNRYSAPCWRTPYASAGPSSATYGCARDTPSASGHRMAHRQSIWSACGASLWSHPILGWAWAKSSGRRQQFTSPTSGASRPMRTTCALLPSSLRTLLGVPILKEAEVIGVFGIYRQEVRPFSDKQIELVKSFASQAVIAIEKARLFAEIAEKSRELEIASQHKSQFVANMNHELRTPLAASLGYAELMQEGFYEPQGPKSLHALARIRSNGTHLLGLINGVLDIAKIESGQFNLNLTEYALENVVETVHAATEALAETKRLGLRTGLPRPYLWASATSYALPRSCPIGSAMPSSSPTRVRCA